MVFVFIKFVSLDMINLIWMYVCAEPANKCIAYCSFKRTYVCLIAKGGKCFYKYSSLAYNSDLEQAIDSTFIQ